MGVAVMEEGVAWMEEVGVGAGVESHRLRLRPPTPTPVLVESAPMMGVACTDPDPTNGVSSHLLLEMSGVASGADADADAVLPTSGVAS